MTVYVSVPTIYGNYVCNAAKRLRGDGLGFHVPCLKLDSRAAQVDRGEDERRR